MFTAISGYLTYRTSRATWPEYKSPLIPLFKGGELALFLKWEELAPFRKEGWGDLASQFCASTSLVANARLSKKPRICKPASIGFYAVGLGGAGA